MSKPKPTNEAKQLYTMVALMKCAEQVKEYLCACKGVGGTIKDELKNIFVRMGRFETIVINPLPVADREAWRKDWNRDYGVFTAVFGMMADMTDEQREQVEMFCTAIASGEEIIIENK